MQEAIRIQKATLQEISLVLSMASFYRYDLSEFTKWPLDENGTYRCFGLEKYWSHQNLPLLLFINDEIAGFALIQTHPTTYEMGEFFILRKFRSQGVGARSAHTIFAKYFGTWHIPILACNHPALDFWTNVLQNYDVNVTELIEEVDALCVMEFRIPRSENAS